MAKLRVERRPSQLALGAALALALLAVASPASAQPFGSWLQLGGGPVFSGYVRVPHDPALNPTGNFTFEAWVAISGAGAGCYAIAGKGYFTTWAVWVCYEDGKPRLRSFLKGSVSSLYGGQLEVNRWTHVAVVFNGTQRRHYVNGELVGTVAETGPLPTNTQELRIGSDVNLASPLGGAIDEVRLWNVARTQAQIRADMGRELAAPQAGLVAVWPFNGNTSDAVGPHDGSIQSTGVGFQTFPVLFDCGANTATSLCLLDRFRISARWRTDPPGTLTNGQAPVAGAANDGSGLFQFFGADNWEIMVKALNGCGLNSRFWIFSAATTNVFYRLEVTDVRGGRQKIYFNYPGPPAPAVTDTDAFATCP